MIKSEDQKNFDTMKNRGALNYLVIEYLKTLDFGDNEEKKRLIQKLEENLSFGNFIDVNLISHVSNYELRGQIYRHLNTASLTQIANQYFSSKPKESKNFFLSESILNNPNNTNNNNSITEIFKRFPPSSKYYYQYQNMKKYPPPSDWLSLHKKNITPPLSKTFQELQEFRTTLNYQHMKTILGHVQVDENLSISPVPIFCMCFSENGEFIYTGDDIGTIKVWSTLTGGIVETFRLFNPREENSAINDMIAFNNCLIACSEDKSVIVWNTKTLEICGNYNFDESLLNVSGYCYTYEGIKRHLLIVGAQSGKIYFIDMDINLNRNNNNKIISRFDDDDEYKNIFPIKFHLDKSIQEAYNLGKSKSLELSGMSSDDYQGLLVSGFHDGLVCIWDTKRILDSAIQKREFLHNFKQYVFYAQLCHKTTVQLVEFSSDKSHFLTGSLDGTVLVWKIFPELIKKIRKAYLIKKEDIIIGNIPVSNITTIQEGEDRIKCSVNIATWTSKNNYVIAVISSKPRKKNRIEYNEGYNYFNFNVCNYPNKNEDDSEKKRTSSLLVYSLKLNRVIKKYNEKNSRGLNLNDENYVFGCHPLYEEIIFTLNGTRNIILFNIKTGDIIKKFKQNDFFFDFDKKKPLACEGCFSKKGDYFAISSYSGSLSIFSLYSKNSYSATYMNQFYSTEFDRNINELNTINRNKGIPHLSIIFPKPVNMYNLPYIVEAPYSSFKLAQIKGLKNILNKQYCLSDKELKNRFLCNNLLYYEKNFEERQIESQKEEKVFKFSEQDNMNYRVGNNNRNNEENQQQDLMDEQFSDDESYDENESQNDENENRSHQNNHNNNNGRGRRRNNNSSYSRDRNNNSNNINGSSLYNPREYYDDDEFVEMEEENNYEELSRDDLRVTSQLRNPNNSSLVNSSGGWSHRLRNAPHNNNNHNTNNNANNNRVVNQRYNLRHHSNNGRSTSNSNERNNNLINSSNNGNNVSNSNNSYNLRNRGGVGDGEVSRFIIQDSGEAVNINGSSLINNNINNSTINEIIETNNSVKRNKIIIEDDEISDRNNKNNNGNNKNENVGEDEFDIVNTGDKNKEAIKDNKERLNEDFNEEEGDINDKFNENEEEENYNSVEYKNKDKYDSDNEEYDINESDINYGERKNKHKNKFNNNNNGVNTEIKKHSKKKLIKKHKLIDEDEEDYTLPKKNNYHHSYNENKTQKQKHKSNKEYSDDFLDDEEEYEEEMEIDDDINDSDYGSSIHEVKQVKHRPITSSSPIMLNSSITSPPQYPPKEKPKIKINIDQFQKNKNHKIIFEKMCDDLNNHQCFFCHEVFNGEKKLPPEKCIFGPFYYKENDSTVLNTPPQNSHIEYKEIYVDFNCLLKHNSFIINNRRDSVINPLATIENVIKYNKTCFRCDNSFATMKCDGCNKCFHSNICLNQMTQIFDEKIYCFDCFKKKYVYQNMEKINTNKLNYNNLSKDYFTVTKIFDSSYFPQLGEEVYFILHAYLYFLRENISYILYEIDQPSNIYFWRDITFIQKDSSFNFYEPFLCKVKKITYDFPNEKTLNLIKDERKDLQENLKILIKITLEIKAIEGAEINIVLFDNENPDFLVRKHVYDQTLKYYKNTVIDKKENNVEVNLGPDIIKVIIVDNKGEESSGKFLGSKYNSLKVITEDNTEEQKYSFWDLVVKEDNGVVENKDNNDNKIIITTTEKNSNDLEYEENKKKMEYIMKGMLETINSVCEKNSQQTDIFREIVNENVAPGYYEEVPVPMYINLIIERLENLYYLTEDSIKFDIQLLASNALKYNRDDSEIAKNALELKNRFLNEVEKLKVKYEKGKNNEEVSNKNELLIEGEDTNKKSLMGKKRKRLSKGIGLGYEKDLGKFGGDNSNDLSEDYLFGNKKKRDLRSSNKTLTKKNNCNNNNVNTINTNSGNNTNNYHNISINISFNNNNKNVSVNKSKSKSKKKKSGRKDK